MMRMLAVTLVAAAWLGLAALAEEGGAAAPKSGMLEAKPADAPADVLAVLRMRTRPAARGEKPGEKTFQLKSADENVKKQVAALLAKKGRVSVTGKEEGNVITVTKIEERFFGTLEAKPADAPAEVLATLKARVGMFTKDAKAEEKTYTLKAANDDVKKAIADLLAKKANVLVAGSEDGGVITATRVEEMRFGPRPGGRPGGKPKDEK